LLPVDAGLEVRCSPGLMLPNPIALPPRKRNLTARLRQINPTGKAFLIYRNDVKPENKKYFCFHSAQLTAHQEPSRPAQRGVGHRHNEGRVAVDADVATDDRD